MTWALVSIWTGKVLAANEDRNVLQEILALEEIEDPASADLLAIIET